MCDCFQIVINGNVVDLVKASTSFLQAGPMRLLKISAGLIIQIGRQVMNVPASNTSLFGLEMAEWTNKKTNTFLSSFVKFHWAKIATYGLRGSTAWDTMCSISRWDVMLLLVIAYFPVSNHGNVLPQFHILQVRYNGYSHEVSIVLEMTSHLGLKVWQSVDYVSTSHHCRKKVFIMTQLFILYIFVLSI